MPGGVSGACIDCVLFFLALLRAVPLQVKEVFRVVSAEEFDAEQQQRGAGGRICRPFAEALGDGRRAAELVADFAR